MSGPGFQDALVDEAALPSADPDLLAGLFAHVVVEAQELTEAVEILGAVPYIGG